MSQRYKYVVIILSGKANELNKLQLINSHIACIVSQVSNRSDIHFAMANASSRIRKDITTLTQDELTLLIKAWTGIQAKDPEDEYSFFKIAGYHGMPFRGAGWGNSQWWGGYCHHGNVLFPTWHRAYVYRLEEALRRIEGCENVTMPYWNEPKNADLKNPNSIVIPEIFTQQTIPNPSGVGNIANPLYSYTFAKSLTDHTGTIDGQNPFDYSKPGRLQPEGTKYTTVRYPQSGLVATQKDLNATARQNALLWPTLLC
jgi:tyrosinase